MLTGIIVALPEETSTLLPQQIAKGDWLSLSDSVIVRCSGAGPENARLATEALVTQGATKIISWGCAAALNNDLQPGDLMLADTLIDARLTRIEINTDWIDKASSLLAKELIVQRRTLAESEALIATSEHKRQIYVQTGADILDMESVSVAKVAKQYNLPFLAIRAVADPVSMNLPKAVNHALNAEGEVILSKLLAFLLLHPLELPGLIKLGLHFNAAKKTLKSVAYHLEKIVNFE